MPTANNKLPHLSTPQLPSPNSQFCISSHFPAWKLPPFAILTNDNFSPTPPPSAGNAPRIDGVGRRGWKFRIVSVTTVLRGVSFGRGGRRLWWWRSVKIVFLNRALELVLLDFKYLSWKLIKIIILSLVARAFSLV